MFRSKSRGFGCGIVIGSFFILGALILLWVNEGRTNLGRVAMQSTLASLDELESLEDGTFVAAQGKLSAAEPIGDMGLIANGPYLSIERQVEMFAWKESSASSDDGADSSSEEKVYTLEWTEDPEDSSEFPEQHRNPPLRYGSTTIKADSARLGKYAINIQELTLPSSESLALTESHMRIGDEPPDIIRSLSENRIYIGRGEPQTPEVGDVRLSYRIVPDDLQVTLFGALAGESIVPYVHKDESTLYRAFTVGRDEAISEMKFEYRAILWGLRIGGTFLVWLGIMIMIGPVTSILSRIPALGRLGNRLIAIVAFFGALIVSVVVIITSIIAHNPILLGLLLLIGGGVGYWLWRNQQQEEQQATAHI